MQFPPPPKSSSETHGGEKWRPDHLYSSPSQCAYHVEKFQKTALKRVSFFYLFCASTFKFSTSLAASQFNDYTFPHKCIIHEIKMLTSKGNNRKFNNPGTCFILLHSSNNRLYRLPRLYLFSPPTRMPAHKRNISAAFAKLPWLALSRFPVFLICNISLAGTQY